MKLVGNIIWIIFGGWLTALLWLIFGIFWCITIIGIPFGLQCFKFAKLTLVPFGTHVALHPGKHPIANILWAVICGWEMALTYAVLGVLCCITIVGIPNGMVSFKLVKLAFLPFGARVGKKRR